MTSLRTCRSLYSNFSAASKNKFAGRAPIEGSNIFTLTSLAAITCTPSAALAFASVFFRDMYTNINLQKAIKLAPKLFV